jgi:hypothetical protein
MSMSFLRSLKLVRPHPVTPEVPRSRGDAVSTGQAMHIDAAVAQAACWGVPLSVLLDGVDR